MPRNKELTARFLKEFRVFDNGPDDRTVIGEIEIDGLVQKIKGKADEGELRSGMIYRFYGYWKDTRWGEQFHFNSFTTESPVDDESLVAYLLQCRGPEKGSITERVAWQLVDAFGENCIDKIIEKPVEAASAVHRWTEEKAMKAALVLRESERFRRVKIELMALLDGRGFPKQTVDRLIKKFGTRAAEVVRDDVYVMMELRGCGFKLCDKMYCDLAAKAASSRENYLQRLATLRRQALCAWYAVSSERSGSTWAPEHVAKGGITQSISGTLLRIDDAIDHAVAQGMLARKDHDGVFLSRSDYAGHESGIANYSTGLLSGDPLWPDPSTFSELDDHQSSELSKSLQKRIGILRGSPGTGKTYSIAALVRRLIQDFGDESVAIMCPTGKAAVRATEALAENHVNQQAFTIHTHLGVQTGADGGWGFRHHEDNPLPYRFIVVDETSMVDSSLMRSLMAATDANTHILLTGDAGQLAPVGHGKPFLDLQQVFPCGSLTEIRRNSGRIVKACAEIRDHHRFTPSPEYDLSAGENLPWTECKDQDQQRWVLGITTQIEQSGECNPIWDLQILTAVNDNTPVSRKVLNPLLQNLLNPHGERYEKNPFRVGDKIVCLQNGWYKLADDPEQSVRVANGDLAEVLAIEPARMFLEVKNPSRTIISPAFVNRDSDGDSRGAVGDWDLGYCLSVHKSQGSQWPFTILCFDSSPRAQRVQSRQWLFTGLSRASQATFGLGELQKAQAACRRDGIAGRKTFLVEECRKAIYGAPHMVNSVFALS